MDALMQKIAGANLATQSPPQPERNVGCICEQQSNPMSGIADALLDNKTLEHKDVPKSHVFFDAPLLYPRVDENGPDYIIANRRSIEYDLFIELVHLIALIVEGRNDAQIELSKQLIDSIVERAKETVCKTCDGQSHAYEPLIKLVEITFDTVQATNSSTQYSDLLNDGLNFDPIVRYTNDLIWNMPVVEPPPVTTNERQPLALYSQLTSEEEMRVRAENNDSDLNRAYRTLEFGNKMLSFTDGYLAASSHQYINLALVYLLLIINSNPINSLTDLRARYTMMIVDALFRSRVLNAWQKNPVTLALLHDIIETHDAPKLVNMMVEPSAEVRINRFLNILSETSSAPYVENVSYAQYIKSLNTTIITVEGVRYFAPSYQMFETLLNMLPSALKLHVEKDSRRQHKHLTEHFETQLHELEILRSTMAENENQLVIEGAPKIKRKR